MSVATTFVMPARKTCAAEENFQIVELNGAASEATNIYDARNFAVHKRIGRSSCQRPPCLRSSATINRLTRGSRSTRYGRFGGNGENIPARHYLIRSRIRCVPFHSFLPPAAFASR